MQHVIPPTMISAADRLPPEKADELEYLIKILSAEFEEAQKLTLSPRRTAGKILKIILFGSYARGDWVEDDGAGYRSDYDLLVVVDDARFTDTSAYWHAAEDRILRDPQITTPVTLIVHTLREVNDALARGQYFFSEIVRDGVVLYARPGSRPFKSASPPNEEEARRTSEKYLSDWTSSAARRLEMFQVELERGKQDPIWRRDAAFTLHQAAERCYVAILLGLTFHSPKTHDLKLLRSLAEARLPELTSAWPRASRADRRRFELLRRAYVEARYSGAFQISEDDLLFLSERVQVLFTIAKGLIQHQ